MSFIDSIVFYNDAVNVSVDGVRMLMCVTGKDSIQRFFLLIEDVRIGFVAGNLQSCFVLSFV